MTTEETTTEPTEEPTELDFDRSVVATLLSGTTQVFAQNEAAYEAAFNLDITDSIKRAIENPEAMLVDPPAGLADAVANMLKSMLLIADIIIAAEPDGEGG